MKNIFTIKTISTILTLFFVSVILLTPASAEAGFWDDATEWIGGVWDSAVEVASDGGAWLADKTLGNAFEGIMWIFFLLSGLFLKFGGFLLDFSIVKSLDSEMISGLVAVEKGWEAFRDVANMFFIFILLYIAIGTILRLNRIQWKRDLASVIIVALLINFSLFFTKVIIDASNVLAIHFYNGIQTTITKNGNTIVAHGPSLVFMEGAGLQTMFDEKAWDAAGIDEYKRGIIYFFGTIFQTIAGFTMLAGAILLIGRLVKFIFLMVLSPIAFVGMILPMTQPYARQWWSSLLSSAFVAPAYLAMLYIVSLVIREPDLAVISNQGNGAAPSFADAILGKGSAFGIIFNFIVLIGLTWGALVVAGKISSGLTSSAIGGAKKVSGMLAGGAIAGGAIAGRRVGGYAGRKLAENQYLQNAALNSQSRAGRLAARATLYGGDKMYQGSWDMRKVPLVGAAATGYAARKGLGDARMGQNMGKGGRKAALDAKAKKYQDKRERLADIIDDSRKNRKDLGIEEKYVAPDDQRKIQERAKAVEKAEKRTATAKAKVEATKERWTEKVNASQSELSRAEGALEQARSSSNPDLQLIQQYEQAVTDKQKALDAIKKDRQDELKPFEDDLAQVSREDEAKISAAREMDVKMDGRTHIATLEKNEAQTTHRTILGKQIPRSEIKRRREAAAAEKLAKPKKTKQETWLETLSEKFEESEKKSTPSEPPAPTGGSPS